MSSITTIEQVRAYVEEHNNSTDHKTALAKKYSFFKTGIATRISDIFLCAGAAIAVTIISILKILQSLLNTISCGLFKKPAIYKYDVDLSEVSLKLLFRSVVGLFRHTENRLFDSEGKLTEIPNCIPFSDDFNSSYSFVVDSVTGDLVERKPAISRTSWIHTRFDNWFKEKISAFEMKQLKGPNGWENKWTASRILFHLVARVAHLAYIVIAVVTRLLDFVLGTGGVILSLLMAFTALFTSNVRFNVATDRMIKFTFNHLGIFALPMDILNGITRFLNPTNYKIFD